MNALQALIAKLDKIQTGGNCVALVGETSEFGFVVATNKDGTDVPTDDDYLILCYSSYKGWINGEEPSMVETYELF